MFGNAMPGGSTVEDVMKGIGDTPPPPPSSPASTPKSTKTSTPLPQIEKKLLSLFATAGSLVSLRCSVCGQHILDTAEAETKALIELAKQNPRIRKALDALAEGGAWGEFFFATGMMVLPIMQHHGKLNLPFIPGFPTPAKPSPHAGHDVSYGIGQIPVEDNVTHLGQVMPEDPSAQAQSPTAKAQGDGPFSLD